MGIPEERPDMSQRVAEAQLEFPDQDQLIADVVEELTQIMDVYTRTGGNDLGGEVVTSWSAKAVKTLVSSPGGFFPDKLKVKGVIDVQTESGKEFRLTVERTA